MASLTLFPRACRCAGGADRGLRYRDPQAAEHGTGRLHLIQATKEQIDALRDDHDFARWVTLIQLVADKVGIVDAWVNQGVPDAIGLYEKRSSGSTDPVHRHS
jgi:hypothetical protein